MKKVLIVEDELNLLNLYGKFLVSNGFEVETASDGEIALAKLKTYRPDIIFLDLLLPTINGNEVLKRIRENIELKHIPIVMITGTTDNMKESFELGATAFVPKGVNTPKKIMEAIRIYAK